MDSYRPARHEVGTGVVARAYRAVRGALETPSRWTGEHGFDVMRVLVESQLGFREPNESLR
jgi:hypothetical protein